MHDKMLHRGNHCCHVMMWIYRYGCLKEVGTAFLDQTNSHDQMLIYKLFFFTEKMVSFV